MSQDYGTILYQKQHKINMDKIKDIIRDEIVRQKEYSRIMSDNAINSNMRNFFDGADDMCNQLLNFIDSQPEEKSNKDLEDEIATWLSEHLRFENKDYEYLKEPLTEWAGCIARHFYELGQASVPMPDEQPSKGLNVADFCKPIDPGIAQCIADNWWEMLGEDEQPEVDLEKELKTIRESDEWRQMQKRGSYMIEALLVVARHFYELGRNAQENWNQRIEEG